MKEHAAFGQPEAIDTFIREEELVLVHPERIWEPPADFNYHALEWLEVSPDEFKGWVEKAQKILNAPMIIDRFDKDHDARRAWRGEMEEKYGEEVLKFLFKTKLAVKMFSLILFVVSDVKFCLEDFEGEDPRKTRLEGVVRKFEEGYSRTMKGYKDMALEEKKTAVIALDKLIEEFLMELQTTHE